MNTGILRAVAVSLAIGGLTALAQGNDAAPPDWRGQEFTSHTVFDTWLLEPPSPQDKLRYYHPDTRSINPTEGWYDENTVWLYLSDPCTTDPVVDDGALVHCKNYLTVSGGFLPDPNEHPEAYERGLVGLRVQITVAEDAGAPTRVDLSPTIRPFSESSSGLDGEGSPTDCPSSDDCIFYIDLPDDDHLPDPPGELELSQVIRTYPKTRWAYVTYLRSC